jgi:catechol 2,3-dioxygenase-like lactoylglutathione lyase family enzyme
MKRVKKNQRRTQRYSLEDRKINRRGGRRGVYFRDPNGHALELLTVG